MNPGPPPRQGGVLTRLDDGPLTLISVFWLPVIKLTTLPEACVYCLISMFSFFYVQIIKCSINKYIMYLVGVSEDNYSQCGVSIGVEEHCIRTGVSLEE